MTNRFESVLLTDWVFWMVRDILESGEWKIVIRHAYVNTGNGRNLALSKALSKRELAGKKYHKLDAFVDEDERFICIDAGAEDRALCLFHECLEILFSDWKDDYFVPERWDITEKDDPILFLEKATWNYLTEEQKEAIASFLPKRP